MAKFKVGDMVRHKDGALCRVEGIKEDGKVFAVETDDHKHSFDAPETDLTKLGEGGRRRAQVAPVTPEGARPVLPPVAPAEEVRPNPPARRKP